MQGKRIGYIRVSSVDQSTQRQLVDVKLDKVFEDKASGKDVHRPEFQKMCEFVREGDTVIVHSLDRLARNLGDLKSIVYDFVSRGIVVQFMKENLTFTPNKQDPMSELLLNIIGAMAEFERSLIKERQREGIKIAKEQGVYQGRKKALSKDQVEELKRRVASGEKKSHVAKDFGISRFTLYKYLEPSPQ